MVPGAIHAARRLGTLAHRPLPAPPPRWRLGPWRPGAWRSPRPVRLTAHLGLALAVTFAICLVTGLFSHLHQHQPGWLALPSRPVDLYRVTQGVHVATGLAAIPLLGAKLWSVYPRLFEWPPARDPVHAIERLSVAVLVSSALFELASGVLNIALWYEPMPFFFPAAHYWVAWLAAGAVITHVGVKLPLIREALRPAPVPPPDGLPAGTATGSGSTRASATDIDSAARTGFEGNAHSTTAAGIEHQNAPTTAGTADGSNPDTPTGARAGTGVEGGVAADAEQAGAPGWQRRGLLTAVAAAAGVITVSTVGQTLAPLSALSVLAPRRPGNGPQRLPVNRTARAAGVAAVARDPNYRLDVAGPQGTLRLSLADLAALPQHTARLPIACVEGWSASAYWTGVRLRDLAALAGVDPARARARVESLQRQGRYRASTVDPEHLRDSSTLLALRLHGEPLHPDHGYPCRLIAPDRPGVLQTKWVARVTLWVAS